MSVGSILILPGDGIGPEVMAQVRRIIDWYGDKRGLSFDVSEDLVGGAAYDVHGVPLADETMAKAQEVDAVLLGAVGGPQWSDPSAPVRPEQGLLALSGIALGVAVVLAVLVVALAIRTSAARAAPRRARRTPGGSPRRERAARRRPRRLEARAVARAC